MSIESLFTLDLQTDHQLTTLLLTLQSSVLDWTIRLNCEVLQCVHVSVLHHCYNCCTCMHIHIMYYSVFVNS